MKKSLSIICVFFALLLIFACVGKQVKTTEAPGLTYTYESPIDPIILWTWTASSYPIGTMHPIFGEGVMIMLSNPDTAAEWVKGMIFIRDSDWDKTYADGEYAFISACAFVNKDGLRIYFYDYNQERNRYIYDTENSKNNRQKA